MRPQQLPCHDFVTACAGRRDRHVSLRRQHTCMRLPPRGFPGVGLPRPDAQHQRQQHSRTGRDCDGAVSGASRFSTKARSSGLGQFARACRAFGVRRHTAEYRDTRGWMREPSACVRECSSAYCYSTAYRTKYMYAAADFSYSCMSCSKFSMRPRRTSRVVHCGSPRIAVTMCAARLEASKACLLFPLSTS